MDASLPPPLIVLSRRDLAALMPFGEYVNAVADAFRMLSNRISIFTSLPLDKLSKLSLQRKLDEIGQTGVVASKQSA